jgi:hypothetical protein
MINTRIEHISGNSTAFVCQTLDLMTTVYVSNPHAITMAQLAADIVEFGAWHCTWVLPQLKSFQGYDTGINYSFKVPKLIFQGV